jgi:hypothetical protein
VFDTLRAVPRETLARLSSSRPRPYEPTAELEEREEHFVIPISELPAPPRRRRRIASSDETDSPEARTAEGNGSTNATPSGPAAALPDVADLIDLTRRVDDLDPIDAGQLAQGSFLFYGIVLPGPAGPVAFIKKSDPVTTLRKGRAYFRYADALVATDRPDFMLYPDIDLVVGPSGIAAFHKNALNELLADVRVVLQDVPANVGHVQTSLALKVPLTTGARDALQEFCSTRPSMAARLRTLSARIDAINLTPDLVREALQRHGEDPSVLVNAAGEFDFAGEGVRIFLDIAESRWFEDEFSNERRRADRYSIRRPTA